MLLHIVNKSPAERDAFAACVRHAQQDASVLLIEDGVYAALAGSITAPLLAETLARLSVYALQPDVEARGLGDRLAPGVKLVDYAGFVELVASHSATQSWL
jgi:tRNA 2-thiouridine synthesizing protein B